MTAVFVYIDCITLCSKFGYNKATDRAPCAGMHVALHEAFICQLANVLRFARTHTEGAKPLELSARNEVAWAVAIKFLQGPLKVWPRVLRVVGHICRVWRLGYV